MPPTPTPTSGGPPCPDFDGDGAVTVRDLIEVARRMGSEVGERRYDPTFDLNQDGKIDVHDLRIVHAQFGEECP